VERDLHLGRGRTLATRLGAGPELGLVAVAVAMLVAAAVVTYRRRGAGS
jgi:apolipoprotein N-acyltransferase